MSEDNELLEFCRRGMSEIRHSVALGIEAISASKGKVILRLPSNPKIVGDIETGALHGGVIFSLADQASGFAVFCQTFPQVRLAPTLDLRIDHMRKSSKGADLLCEAECYRATDNIGFTKAVLHEGNIENPVAYSVGSYMMLDTGKEQGWLRK